jgi:hypothetical protein
VDVGDVGGEVGVTESVEVAGAVGEVEVAEAVLTGVVGESDGVALPLVVLGKSG